MGRWRRPRANRSPDSGGVRVPDGRQLDRTGRRHHRDAPIPEEGEHAPFPCRGRARRVPPLCDRPVPRHLLGRAAVPVRVWIGARRRPAGRGGRRILLLGGHPGPGQPLRPPSPGRTLRSAALLDDGPVRRGHQCDGDLHHGVLRADQDRGGGRADLPVDHRCGRALYGPVHRLGDRPRPQSAGPRRRPHPWDLEVPGVPADPAAQCDPREPASPAGLQRHLHDQPGHRAGRHADRRYPPLVRPEDPRQQGSAA